MIRSVAGTTWWRWSNNKAKKRLEEMYAVYFWRLCSLKTDLVIFVLQKIFFIFPLAISNVPALYRWRIHKWSRLNWHVGCTTSLKILAGRCTTHWHWWSRGWARHLLFWYLGQLALQFHDSLLQFGLARFQVFVCLFSTLQLLIILLLKYCNWIYYKKKLLKSVHSVHD